METRKVKVLKYAKNGNDLVQPYVELYKYSEGIYFTPEYTFDNFDMYFDIIFEEKGVYWKIQYANARVKNYLDFEEKTKTFRDKYFENLYEIAARGGFINSLEIKVCGLLGMDTEILIKSRESYLKGQEEEERKKEEAESARIKQKEEEERVRKEKLLNAGIKAINEGGDVPAEALELLAWNVGITINIRTLGQIRDIVNFVRIEGENLSISYRRKGKFAPSFDGVFALTRNIIKKIAS